MDSYWFQTYAGVFLCVITSIVGMVFAIRYWRRASGAFTLALLGLTVILLIDLAQPFLHLWIIPQDFDESGYLAIYSILSFVRSAAFVLVVTAIFVGRREPVNERLSQTNGRPAADMPTPMPPLVIPSIPSASTATPPGGDHSITARPPRFPHDQ